MVTSAATTADLTKLVASFGKAKQDVPKESQKLLESTGDQIATVMRAMVPVKTGRLLNSITVISEPGRVVIGPVGVEYSGYVEYGTGTRGEFPGQMYEIRPKFANALTFKINGQWISTQVVHHPGIFPHPYIRPAAAQVLGNLGVEYAEMGKRLLPGASS